MNCEFDEIEPGIFKCRRAGCSRQNRDPLPQKPFARCRAIKNQEVNPKTQKQTALQLTEQQALQIISTYCKGCQFVTEHQTGRVHCSMLSCNSCNFPKSLQRGKIRSCPIGLFSENNLRELLTGEG